VRDVTNQEKILKFMRAFGQAAREMARVYFTGGATTVLMGWRDTTIDIALAFDPELDELFRALPVLKEKLEINIELACPSDFIPPLPDWQERSRYIRREGKVDFYHYDPYSQALAKIEHGHAQDLLDVEAMRRDGLLDRAKLLALFEAIDPGSFSKAVHRITDHE
jgi:hypothetical protein